MNEYIPGTFDWKILSTLDQKQGDIVVSKTANDPFYKSELDKILKEHNIKELVITGCATDFCVDSTIRSAIGRDYKITIIENCHTTGNRPHMSAEKVIEHHNWIWANLIPTQGNVSVVPFEEFIQNKVTAEETA